MPQHHRPVSLTGRQFLDPHRLGCTLDAWGSTAGGVPAALACLVAHRPGNMPADLPGHPVGGAWSGHRLLMAGDYAEDRDAVSSHDGPPLSRLHRLLALCEDQEHRPYRDPGGAWVTAADQAAERRRELDALLEAVAPHGPFADVTRQLVGMVEHGASVRFCGEGLREAVPVKASAERDADGGLRYVLADRVRRDPEALGVIWRMLGYGGWLRDPAPDPDALPPGAGRWPWDRPPTGLSPHDVPDGDADFGQVRLYANLDRGEYFDPAASGPTCARARRSSGPPARSPPCCCIRSRGAATSPPAVSPWSGPGAATASC